MIRTIVHGMTINCHPLQDERENGNENKNENESIVRLLLQIVVVRVEEAVEPHRAAVAAVRLDVPVIRQLIARVVAAATAANTTMLPYRRFGDLLIQTMSLDQHQRQSRHQVAEQVPIGLVVATAVAAGKAVRNHCRTVQLFHPKHRRTIGICVKGSSNRNNNDMM